MHIKVLHAKNLGFIIPLAKANLTLAIVDEKEPLPELVSTPPPRRPGPDSSPSLAKQPEPR